MPKKHHHHYQNNNYKIRNSSTLVIALLIVFFLLYNIGMQNSYEQKVKQLETKVVTLDEELRIAQEEILEFMSSNDFRDTLKMFNDSHEELGTLADRIDDLTEQLGE